MSIEIKIVLCGLLYTVVSCGPGVSDGSYEIEKNYFVESVHSMGTFLLFKDKGRRRIMVKQHIMGIAKSKNFIAAIQYDTKNTIAGNRAPKKCNYWIIDVTKGVRFGPMSKDEFKSLSITNQVEMKFRFAPKKSMRLCSNL